MRPNIIEIKYDWLGWQSRADYTGGRWKYIPGLPRLDPELLDVNLIKIAIMNANPEYVVVCPVLDFQMEWHDA